jgi:hypothetical protein
MKGKSLGSALHIQQGGVIAIGEAKAGKWLVVREVMSVSGSMLLAAFTRDDRIQDIPSAFR